MEAETAAGCEREGQRIDYADPALCVKLQSNCVSSGGQRCPCLDISHTESPIITLLIEIGAKLGDPEMLIPLLNSLLWRNAHCGIRSTDNMSSVQCFP